MNTHPPFNTTDERILFVEGKVMSGLVPEKNGYLLYRICVFLFCLKDLHFGEALEQIRHHAFVGRVKMRDKDKRHSAVGWHMGKKLSECLQPAGRTTHPDNTKGILFNTFGRCLPYRGYLRRPCCGSFSLAFIRTFLHTMRLPTV